MNTPYEKTVMRGVIKFLAKRGDAAYQARNNHYALGSSGYTLGLYSLRNTTLLIRIVDEVITGAHSLVPGLLLRATPTVPDAKHRHLEYAWRWRWWKWFTAGGRLYRHIKKMRAMGEFQDK